MIYTILASGSDGNALYIRSAQTSVLIDAGLFCGELEGRLRHHNINPGTVEAIALTHAHSDHIKGAGQFAHKYRIPLIGDPATLERVDIRPNQKLISWTDPVFTVKDLRFTPFALSHDCQPTYGYLIESGGSRLAVCTDLGMITPGVKDHLSRANALVIEANHDPELLMGYRDYPWHLRQRISSPLGHLSNFNCGELLAEILRPSHKQIVLAHLSEKTNTPELALRTVLEFIGDDRRPMVTVASQAIPTHMFSI
ncbi:MAG: MBL fold metallo-hydrolase [candidate division KSB1 bacterium]|nr:MBL fold metallo-hydrolase [candidate division KSB1 bacterium]